MPERIEEILRAIHILLSKGERYNEDPDKVIISKREMFDLLEQFNYAVVEVMDRFEATTRSKERAKQELLETGQEIIDAASQQAEDVYAASLLYTDGALNEIYAEIVDARSDIRKEYEKFEDSIAERLETIRSNQKELMDQLNALSQGKKYFDLIEDYNKKVAEAEAAAKAAAEKAERSRTTKDGEEAVIPEKFRKKPRKKDELPALGTALEPAPEEEVHRNLLPVDEEEIDWGDDSMTFAPVEIKVSANWGSRENNVFENTTLKTKKDRDREKKYGKKPKKKSRYDFDDEEIELTVDPDEDPNVPRSFTSEDLDAEYLRWQDEQQEEEEKTENLLSKAAEALGIKKKK